VKLKTIVLNETSEQRTARFLRMHLNNKKAIRGRVMLKYKLKESPFHTKLKKIDNAIGAYLSPKAKLPSGSPFSNSPASSLFKSNSKENLNISTENRSKSTVPSFNLSRINQGRLRYRIFDRKSSRYTVNNSGQFQMSSGLESYQDV
jgi:hypothetical protein